MTVKPIEALDRAIGTGVIERWHRRRNTPSTVGAGGIVEAMDDETREALKALTSEELSRQRLDRVWWLETEEGEE